MIIYLVNGDDGILAAYKDLDIAAKEAAVSIAMKSHEKYSEKDLQEVEDILKKEITDGFHCYEYRIEPIDMI